MVRAPLTPQERERGKQLAAVLRAARGSMSLVQLASETGLSHETLRKIEAGRIPSPSFFTVAAIADALDISLDYIASLCSDSDEHSQLPA
ncbi:helix-turn-helix domain-containing protein [Kibdelosporangium persicum]|uniref:Transcriptional regulator n=1 Tax=Kibdelosporangium persicum TaxID=2698649 RepID=A0ABX2F264_9PSEU|nr:helix-turn-helix transcriptional regulator [Kibdelosporangium persicum]NRN65071.1 Transcriptional regulator [Kibdelosporangium persicum]